MSEIKCTCNAQSLTDYFKELGFEFSRNQFYKQISIWTVKYNCGHKVLTIKPTDPNSVLGKMEMRIQGVADVDQVKLAFQIYQINPNPIELTAEQRAECLVRLFQDIHGEIYKSQDGGYSNCDQWGQLHGCEECPFWTPECSDAEDYLRVNEKYSRK